MPPRTRSGGGGKTVGIVLGIAAAMVVLCGGGGAVAYFAFLRGDDPEQVVEAYFEAAKVGDCDEMVDLVTESTWRQGGAASRAEAVADCRAGFSARNQGEMYGGWGSAVTLDSTRLVSEGGGTAVVAATVTTQPHLLVPGTDSAPVTETVDYDLRKEGRQWRIDGTIPGLGSGLEPGGDGIELPGADDPGIDVDTPPSLPDLDRPPDAAPAPEPGSLGPSPEDAVLSFYGAWQRSDCPGMVSLSTEEYWVEGAFTSSSSDPTTICQDTISSGELRTDLTYVNEGGFQVELDLDTYDVAVATVRVRHSFGNEPESGYEFTLVDVAGYWTIHGSSPA